MKQLRPAVLLLADSLVNCNIRYNEIFFAGVCCVRAHSAEPKITCSRSFGSSCFDWSWTKSWNLIHWLLLLRGVLLNAHTYTQLSRTGARSSHSKCTRKCNFNKQSLTNEEWKRAPESAESNIQPEFNSIKWRYAKLCWIELQKQERIKRSAR